MKNTEYELIRREAQGNFFKACDKLNIIGDGSKDELDLLDEYVEKLKPKHGSAFKFLYNRDHDGLHAYIKTQIEAQNGMS